MVLNILEYIGMVSFLVAYCLLILGKIKSNSITFHLLNMSGAFGIGMMSLSKQMYHIMFLEVIWFLIGFVSIIIILVVKCILKWCQKDLKNALLKKNDISRGGCSGTSKM